MKIIFNLFFLMLFTVSTAVAQESPIGLWKTIDDNTGEEKSYVEIYEKDGKYYGKIDRLLLKPNDTVCAECPGDKQGQPLVGMDILWELEPYKDYYSYGKIMDPENGKIYKCSMWLENGNLKLRGYIGLSALGRNQEWLRVE